MNTPATRAPSKVRCVRAKALGGGGGGGRWCREVHMRKDKLSVSQMGTRARLVRTAEANTVSLTRAFCSSEHRTDEYARLAGLTVKGGEEGVRACVFCDGTRRSIEMVLA
jgi:hypothetical protein